MTPAAASVIVQQYSSHTFNSLRFNFRKVKYNGRFKKVIFSKFHFIKTAYVGNCVTWNCKNRGVSVENIYDILFTRQRL